MARGGSRPGAGRKRANTPTPATPARAPVREDMVIEWREISTLIPYARNARTHSEAQIAEIAGSIREFGFTNPVLIDPEGGIIAGHGRVLAARQLGMDQIPTICLSGLSEAQRRAYRLTDNKIALNSGWDPELLKIELGELKLGGFDLALTGFGELELGEIFADRTEGLTDPDDAPAAPEHSVSEPGDLWIMGRHRLLCGDSTVATDVERVLGGVEPHLMITDPPWGVSYDPDWRNKSESVGWSQSISTGIVQNDDRADWREAWLLFPGDVAYTWCPPGTTQINHYNSLIAAGFEIRMQIIWAKSHFPVSRGHYHVQHEPCWYAVRKSKTGHWSGDRKQTTLWHIANRTAFRGKMDGPEDARTGHGTQKPVECMQRPIENNSSPGQAVYDPFLGSGTTVIAAEQTGRSCIGLEISPAYCDVIVARWQNFTGAPATLAEDGRTFDEIAAERGLGSKLASTNLRQASAV